MIIQIIFQSTPPRGRRLQNLATFYIYLDFNPRLREGGDNICYSLGIKYKNFNPRLREGGDNVFKNTQKLKRISIHASAREATGWSAAELDALKISIHASAREATDLIGI